MYIKIKFLTIIKLIKRYKLINFIFQPRRIIWLLKIKILNIKIPLKTLPSYEHRELLKLIPVPDNIIDVGFNKGQFSSLILLFQKNSK